MDEGSSLTAATSKYDDRLSCLIMFLQTSKNEIQPYHKEKIVGCENQIQAQQGNARGEDWQGRLMKRLNQCMTCIVMNLRKMYWRLTAKLQKHDAIPQQTPKEKLEKARLHKVSLEHSILSQKPVTHPHLHAHAVQQSQQQQQLRDNGRMNSDCRIEIGTPTPEPQDRKGSS
ncbi:hypothetical protein C2S51_001657 [Perilla frutescens var. frutescens]|nr:hypothetical protein C2S51_001657 [Perilla frutescens var. frutescens]